MLHEIMLSLSGQPSPLLRAAASGEAHGRAGPGPALDKIITPPERALLASIAHLGQLHAKLLTSTAQMAAQHPSTICRAVATAIDAVHLAAFQRKVLEVERVILRKDAALVGAYNIVPLTAVVCEFDGWTRRMEWLWDIVQFMMRTERSEVDGESVCTGSMLIDRLRGELQTGYADVEETAVSLVRAAELGWLKQVSAWILYGKLPSFGTNDFFVQRTEGEDEFAIVSNLLPAFVTSSTASSMLFIGRSLNHIRARRSGDTDTSPNGTGHLSSQLRVLSELTFPLDSPTLGRTVTGIRQYLSRTTLAKLLPLAKILEMLELLRDFFLLGRGEFAMALTQQADEKMRSRWKRADNLAYEKREGLETVAVKEGEVSSVLDKTWAAMGSMQGRHAEEDEGLERARDLLHLSLAKDRPVATVPVEGGLASIASTPFRNLLFSVPVILTMQVKSPMDLFLGPSDLQTYALINSYLLATRRAHMRLTDLWKITSLRRHHPPPPGPPYGSTRAGREKLSVLRSRQTARSNALRSAWATSSAAVFFFSEMESYLQSEVVAGLWDGFARWLTTGADQVKREDQPRKTAAPLRPSASSNADQEDDVWLAEATASKLDLLQDSPPAPAQPRDPQTLATAHRLYLGTLVRRILLTRQSFTDALYELLVQVDHLVALMHRLHSNWTAADLEADAGVVDAFVDLGREEREVRADLAAVEDRVRRCVEAVVAELRAVEGSHELEDDARTFDEAADQVGGHGAALGELNAYVPRRVGGVDRLLMKLDFGTCFGTGRRGDLDEEEG